MGNEIRVQLTAGAALAFTDVLAGAMENLDPEIIKRAQAAAKSKNKDAAAEVGVSLIKSLLKHSREDTFNFLAEVAGFTPEELRKRPLSDLTEIITQLKSDPQLRDFLEQARGMLKQGSGS